MKGIIPRSRIDEPWTPTSAPHLSHMRYDLAGGKGPPSLNRATIKASGTGVRQGSGPS
ncbi:hypothetical protein Vau01_109800 [Virgisporangium aurantiacum]|uniref:Uncharacterized protein n=1 Tax=Virgisporangium aurantiacum TaxID=175570 RepID=A0A8J3ZGF8_9ACTN|nr:hypothetical protein Vau01_109800 [Virgisporangium aurantiacum]